MSFTYTNYYHHQFDGQFSVPLPMPSPTSCWYPQWQDVQFGYSYPDMAAVSNLETRLDNTDRFVEVLRPPARPQPDPDPSYNQPHYSGAAMNTHLSGEDCQQPHYLNPNIDGQPLYPCYQPDEYEQRADHQLPVPQQPPYTGFDSCRVGEISAPPVPEPPSHPTTVPPYDLPCPPPPIHLPPPQPDLEPNVSVAALVSQLECLTADVERLVSRMDANERHLGDPHTAMRPPPAPLFSIPYTTPVSCPLQQRSPSRPTPHFDVGHHAKLAPAALDRSVIWLRCTLRRATAREPRHHRQPAAATSAALPTVQS